MDPLPAARMATVVPLPAELDLTNYEQVRDRLSAAFASGAAVVVADFTGTRFCDSGALLVLLDVKRMAVARGGQLRLVIPPGSLARRVTDLLGLDRQLLIYPTTRAATARLPGGGPAGSRLGAATVTEPGPAELENSAHPLPCQRPLGPESPVANSSEDPDTGSEVLPFRPESRAAGRTGRRSGPRRRGHPPPFRA
jgi:anti-anti-sigma factor